MKVKVARLCIAFLYEMSLALALWVFSNHSDFIRQGNGNRDGLDMLIIVYFSLPAMFLLSIAKVVFWRKLNFTTFSYFLYTIILLISMVVLDMRYTQISLFTVMIATLLITIINAVEFYFLIKQPMSNQPLDTWL